MYELFVVLFILFDFLAQRTVFCNTDVLYQMIQRLARRRTRPSSLKKVVSIAIVSASHSCRPWKLRFSLKQFQWPVWALGWRYGSRSGVNALRLIFPCPGALRAYFDISRVVVGTLYQNPQDCHYPSSPLPRPRSCAAHTACQSR